MSVRVLCQPLWRRSDRPSNAPIGSVLMTDLQVDLTVSLAAQYRIERELGGGGMSRVFLATELALDRQVVIKVLPSELAVGVSTDRFRREMQLVARLQHPHIVPVLHTGAVNDILFYVMPFIRGESLRARIDRDAAMPIDDSARILREVADALAFAHGEGVVHRDIKPDNVLLSNGHAVVTDFGVAKALGIGGVEGQTGGLTSVGIALGTPVYMAPEQAMADPHVDHRADIYALGVMAYEMLAGQPPFVAPTAQALIAAHISREPEPLRRTRATVPEALDDLVLRCLAKRPADRFQRAQELIPLLEDIAHQSSTRSTVATTAAAPATAIQPMVIAASGLVLLAGIAWVLREIAGLPVWLVGVAVAVVLAGVPLALWRSRRGKPTSPRRLAAHATTRRGLRTAGIFSAVALATITIAFTTLRAAGVGPFATLLTSGAMTERDKVVIAEFGNSTSDSTLGVALTEALSIDLSQSKVLRLMTPVEIRDALARMKRDATTRLTSEVATELAAREGVKVIVTGDVAPFAGGFALSGRVMDVKGTTLYATRTTAKSADEIIPALEKISHDIREEIGESMRSIRSTQSLEQVSTSSLEALQLYSRAIQSQRAGSDDDRMSWFRQAVVLDSGFAMAWRAIYADLNNLRGDPALRVDAAERMYRLRDRLPAHEALLAEAGYANLSGNYEEAIEVYRRVIASWPEDMIAQNGLGLYLRGLGRWNEAERVLSAIVEAGTAASNAHYNLVTTQIPLRKFVEAQRTIALMAERFPTGRQRWQAGYFLASATNRFDDALAISDSLTRTGNAGYRYWGHLYKAEVFWLRGQVANGRRETRGAMQAQLEQRNPGAALREQLWEQWIDLQLRGDTAGVRSRVDEALAARPLDSLPIASRPWGEVVQLRVGLGQLAEAKAIIANYERVMPAALRGDDQAMDRARAQLALAEGRPRDAIPLAIKGLRGCDGCTADLIGAAYERLGVVDSAILAYERGLNPPVYGSGFQNWRPAVVPKAMYRLAELYEQRGNKALARDRYAAFVDLWSKADAPLQGAVATARDRMKALAADR